MTIELIYDPGCPNVHEARHNLRAALIALGLEATWHEWDSSAPHVPQYVTKFGSPTVLVEGRDVAGEEPNETHECCRLYLSSDGQRAVAPPPELIQAALISALPRKETPRRGSSWKHVALAAPGVVLSVVPFGGCPACWPVYAGVLSALGLGFLLSREYLLPVTVLFLAVARLSLARRAGERRGFGPLFLGVAASAVIVVGKFVFEADALAYAGVALLIASSVWNAWPRRVAASCPKCTPSSSEFIQLSAQEK